MRQKINAKEEFTAKDHNTFRASRKDRRRHRAASARRYIDLGVMTQEESLKYWSIDLVDLDGA